MKYIIRVKKTKVKPVLLSLPQANDQVMLGAVDLGQNRKRVQNHRKHQITTNSHEVALRKKRSRNKYDNYDEFEWWLIPKVRLVKFPELFMPRGGTRKNLASLSL